jgi:hypothetical protein
LTNNYFYYKRFILSTWTIDFLLYICLSWTRNLAFTIELRFMIKIMFHIYMLIKSIYYSPCWSLLNLDSCSQKNSHSHISICTVKKIQIFFLTTNLIWFECQFWHQAVSVPSRSQLWGSNLNINKPFFFVS